MLISNIIVSIFLFGGTAQTGGVGTVAVLVPEPTGPILGAVAGASILVPVPGLLVSF